MTTETTQTDNQEREQFESWFLQNNPSWEITPQEKRTGTYIFERANIQWKAWQAVLQSPEVQRLREGWASVPIYPTDEMVRAMFGQPDETGFYHFHGDFGNIAYQFGRLIDAAMEQKK